MNKEKEYYDAQVKYINEIRSIRHDMQAHMIVLQYYLESENYEKAKAYLFDMRKHQAVDSIVVRDTGNDLVNAIVSDALSKSECKIAFVQKGILPENFSMTEYDICTLFSNLFSNAREACEKLKIHKPEILMEVKREKDAFFLAVQNPIEWNIEMDGTRLVSTKSDKTSHGYGMKNIVRVIKAYHGKIDFLITENSFRVEIRFENGIRNEI